MFLWSNGVKLNFNVLSAFWKNLNEMNSFLGEFYQQLQDWNVVYSHAKSINYNNKILDSVPGLTKNACPKISIYEKMLILQFPTAS